MQQRITIWEPPTTLGFVMVGSTLPQKRFFKRVTERFDLHPESETSTTVVRTTELQIKPVFLLGYPIFKVGVRRIHRYVFQNWSESAKSWSRKGRYSVHEGEET